MYACRRASMRVSRVSVRMCWCLHAYVRACYGLLHTQRHTPPAISLFLTPATDFCLLSRKYARTHTHMHVCTRTHIYTHTHTYTRFLSHTLTHTFPLPLVLHICTCDHPPHTPTHTHASTHTHTHTHTHTYTHKLIHTHHQPGACRATKFRGP